MTDRLPHGTRDDAVSWLEKGPDRAPAELLGAVLARTRSTGQRPAFLASLLGAPSGAATWGGIPSTRLWLTAAIAALALLSVIVAAGMWRRDALVVVPPTSGSPKPASPAPTSTTGPGFTPPAQVLQGTREELFDGSLALIGLGGGTRQEGPDQAVLENGAIRVVIDRWPIGVARGIPGLAGTIDGATLEALTSSAGDLIGSQPRLSGLRAGTLNVDFVPASYWVLPAAQIRADASTPFEVLIVAYEGQAYSVVGFARASDSQGAILVDFGRLITSIDFLAGFEFVGLDGAISMTVPGGDHVASSTADQLVIENGGIAIFARSLTVQRATLGDPLALGPIPRAGAAALTLAGTSLDEYAASATAASPTRFPGALRAEVQVGGVLGYQWRILTAESILGREYIDVVLAVAGSDVYALVGSLDMVEDLRFLPRHVTPSSEDTVSGTVGDLHLTMPNGWTITPTENWLYISDAQAGDFFSISQRIDMLQPGGSVVISHPTPGNTSASFTGTGETLAELAVSIDAGLPDVERQEITIGGVRAYRWNVPQFVGYQILTAVAVLEWRDAFYVFQQHYPLDGFPGDTFGLLLRGVELL
jgi:hypothetical protein